MIRKSIGQRLSEWLHSTSEGRELLRRQSERVAHLDTHWDEIFARPSRKVNIKLPADYRESTG